MKNYHAHFFAPFWSPSIMIRRMFDPLDSHHHRICNWSLTDFVFHQKSSLNGADLAKNKLSTRCNTSWIFARDFFPASAPDFFEIALAFDELINSSLVCVSYRLNFVGRWITLSATPLFLLAISSELDLWPVRCSWILPREQDQTLKPFWARTELCHSGYPMISSNYFVYAVTISTCFCKKQDSRVEKIHRRLPLKIPDNEEYGIFSKDEMRSPWFRVSTTGWESISNQSLVQIFRKSSSEPHKSLIDPHNGIRRQCKFHHHSVNWIVFCWSCCLHHIIGWI